MGPELEPPLVDPVDVPEALRLAVRLSALDRTEGAVGEIPVGGLAFIMPQDPAMAAAIRQAVIQELSNRRKRVYADLKRLGVEVTITDQ
jgi:hypothetical protein